MSRKRPKITFEGPPAKVIKDLSKRADGKCTVYGSIQKLPGRFFGGVLVDEYGNELHYKSKIKDVTEALKNMHIGQRIGLFGEFGYTGFIVEKYNPHIE